MATRKLRPGRSRSARLEAAVRSMQQAAHHLVEGEGGSKAMGELQAALYTTRQKIQALRLKR